MSSSQGGGGDGTKAKGPDQELKRAFAELQAKSAETRRRLKMMDLQTENERRTITHAQLTEAEIKSMPEGTRLYNSVGRMFVLSSLGGVVSQLAKKRSNCEEKIKTLSANKDYLEKSLKESENSLRELIVQKKNTA